MSLEPTPNSPPWSSIYSSNSERNWPAKLHDSKTSVSGSPSWTYLRPSQKLPRCTAMFDQSLTPVTASHIVQGRHPVVERLDLSGGFVPNDTHLDLQTSRLHIITGPNMAGKKHHLRQVALITLLAQMGSFVPRPSPDRTRRSHLHTGWGFGQSRRGQSTFMVEMIESAHILNCATARSLILLDEVGRGTSTYDGLSIAWAIAEFIQDPERLGARTLFATHYHEMTQLEGLRAGIVNYSVAVQERNGTVLFLRKIIPGGADRSYGIHVAQLAGLPEAVIHRAKAVLAQLESATSSPHPILRDSTIPCNLMRRYLHHTPCWRKSGKWTSSP